MNKQLLKDTEARIREKHAGKLAPPTPTTSVRDERRAAVAPAVDRVLGGKKKKR